MPPATLPRSRPDIPTGQGWGGEAGRPFVQAASVVELCGLELIQQKTILSEETPEHASPSPAPHSPRGSQELFARWQPPSPAYAS